jgi:TRAP-type C4-dicarboxylate transport system permease small subunit
MRDVLTGPVARLNGRVTWWLARIATVALAAVASVTFCDVIARKLFSKGFTFTVEFTEITMALIVFLGVGLVTHERGHIVVDVVTLRLPVRLRVWLAFVINVLSLGFVTIMIWRLWLQAAFILSKGDTTPIWNAPLWPIAYVIAGGSLFLCTGLLIYVLDAFERARNPAMSPEPEAPVRPFQD